jgi:hypothetical protein
MPGGWHLYIGASRRITKVFDWRQTQGSVIRYDATRSGPFQDERNSFPLTKWLGHSLDESVAIAQLDSPVRRMCDWGSGTVHGRHVYSLEHSG